MRTYRVSPPCLHHSVSILQVVALLQPKQETLLIYFFVTEGGEVLSPVHVSEVLNRVPSDDTKRIFGFHVSISS